MTLNNTKNSQIILAPEQRNTIKCSHYFDFLLVQVIFFLQVSTACLISNSKQSKRGKPVFKTYPLVVANQSSGFKRLT